MKDNKKKQEKKEEVGVRESDLPTGRQEESEIQEESKGQNEEIEVQDAREGKVAELEEKINTLENQLKRAVADYINLERRVDEDRVNMIKFANKELLNSLIPAFNTLFLAAKFTKDSGVLLTVKNILEVLKDCGVEKIDTENKKFNAEDMEVVEVVEGEDGIVIEETRPGFILYGKLLQPALVKVGSAKQN